MTSLLPVRPTRTLPDRARPDLRGEQGQRMPRGGNIDRESMFKEQLERRRGEHDAAVGELKAILRSAEEENATKTAEMLRKLIEKKENDFKKVQEQMEERRKRMEEMMKQREEEMKKRREGAQNQTGERRSRTTTRRPRRQQAEEAEDK